MLLTPEMAALFPSPREWTKPYSWTFFEVGKRSESFLLAIGTLELEGGATRRLDVLALDVTRREWHGRRLMIGEGRRSHSGVKVTPGDVLVHHCKMRGRGIGTLVFNVVTAWAQRTYPGLSVDPITLVRPADGNAFDQLTRFYGRFGFEWDRPAGDWHRHFASKPMTVEALRQYPVEELHDVRRIEMPEALTLILDRLTEADDDRRRLDTLRASEADKRARWRTVGYRLNTIGWVVAFGLGIGAARLWATL